MAELLVPALLGFLVGSVPFAWIAVRWRTGRDLGSEGSGNVGALNSMRVARSPAVGIAVLLLDAAKGVGAVLLARWVSSASHADLAGVVGAVAGHDYNPWLSWVRGRLTGGKGFATAAGGLGATLPMLVACWVGVTLGTWLVLRATRGLRDESPSTALATLLLPPAGLWLYGTPGAITGAALALLVLPKHVAEVRAVLFPPRPE